MKRSREHDEGPDRYDPEEHPAALPTLKLDESSPSSKLIELDPEASDSGPDEVAMICSLPPHREPLTFRSYSEYETHYIKDHSNRCLDCRKNFPSAYFLDIHIEEIHDPLIEVRREKGEHTYSCFVEGCERKCLTHQKRRMHMIDKHMYPKNYFFAVTKEGIDGRRSLLNDGHHRRRSSAASTQSKDPRPKASTHEKLSTSKDHTQVPVARPRDQEPKDTEMTELADAMSAMQFVPNSVRFGRGRAGFSRK